LALSSRVHGPSSVGATFIAQFVTKRGLNTQLLTSTISPVELWAFSTTTEDVRIRDALYQEIGPVAARRVLSDQFPRGSATSEIDLELKNDPSKTIAMVCDQIVKGLIARYRKDQRRRQLLDVETDFL
jgi:intracellular multiplication protein IcmB